MPKMSNYVTILPPSDTQMIKNRYAVVLYPALTPTLTCNHVSHPITISEAI